MSVAGKSAFKTLRVKPGRLGRFEVRDGRRLLGSSENEMLAVWTAVGAAEAMTKSGRTVRVVTHRDGEDVEEFVARPLEPDLFDA